jgi:hypothetical protein
LNHAGLYMDVKSDVPYRGHIAIKTKPSLGPLKKIFVRIPSGTNPNSVSFHRLNANGTMSLIPHIVGVGPYSHYAAIEGLKPNENYIMDYPIAVRDMTIYQMRADAKLWYESSFPASPNDQVITSWRATFRGGTLVKIWANTQPAGIPRYQQAWRKTLADLGTGSIEAPTTSVERFIYNGTETAIPNLGCPTNWVLVPGDSNNHTQNFCVMKFEPQNENGIPVSRPNPVGTIKTPWVRISQQESLAACQSINAHLLQKKEAKAISDNMLLQPYNWATGVVGRGCLFGGHVDLNPNYVIGAPFENEVETNPYAFTGDSAASPAPVCPSGACYTNSFWLDSYRVVNGIKTERLRQLQLLSNGKLSRRTMYLSTGKTIWDWSGNASEWLAETCDSSQFPYIAADYPNGPPGLPDYNTLAAGNLPNNITRIYQPAPEYIEWTRTYLQDYEARVHGPINPKYAFTTLLNSKNGVGKYMGCMAQGNGIYRGSAAYHGSDGGMFQTNMGHTADFRHDFITFRCAKPPQ